MADMTLEEALAAAEVSQFSTDTEQIITVDNDLRTINIPGSITLLGVESDDEVLRLKWKMPKNYGEFDLSEFDIYINYQNEKNDGDAYQVSDKNVSEEFITFSWLVGRTAITTSGKTTFSLCLKKLDTSGNIVKEFNTTTVSLNVLKGLETVSKIVQKNPELFDQIVARLEILEENPVSEEVIASAVEKHLQENPLTAEDVGARPDDWMPTAADVGALPAGTKIPSKLSELSEDTEHKTVTDAEKQVWNAKSDFTGAYEDLAGAPKIPEKTSELQNDSNFQTGEQVQSTVNEAISSKSHFRFEKVTELPSAGEENIIYLVPAEQGDSRNVYDEYLYANDAWENIGGTDIDLSGYALKTELPTTLPNPKKLTIIVNGTKFEYDGNISRTITIDSTADASIPRIEVSGTDVIHRMYPNEFTIFTEPLTSLNYQLSDGVPTEVSEYHFMFTSGETPTEVTHDGRVNVGNLTVEANKIYEISIMENCLTWQSWEVQSA